VVGGLVVRHMKPIWPRLVHFADHPELWKDNNPTEPADFNGCNDHMRPFFELVDCYADRFAIELRWRNATGGAILSAHLKNPRYFEGEYFEWLLPPRLLFLNRIRCVARRRNPFTETS